MTERRYNYLKTMKELHLIQTRNVFTENSTISDVEIDGQLVCHFLEDFDRGLTNEMTEEETAKIKVKKETCIGTGTYEVDITLSNRFKYWLPILLKVVGFIGIRQHKGVRKEHTEGCQLPGLGKGVDTVKNSPGGFEKLMFVYYNHLTLDTEIAKRLVQLTKEGPAKAKECGELFLKHRVPGQKIFITITK